MLFMVVETFKNGDADAVGRRFREYGRMLPEGVAYLESWMEPSGSRCFQIMEAPDEKALDPWIRAWADLVEFEVTPIQTSPDFWQRHVASPMRDPSGHGSEGTDPTSRDSLRWPDELDAAVAAPNHHRLALENEHVRVFETKIEAGETVPLHTHEWSAASFVLSWSDFVRRDERGAVTLDTRRQLLSYEPGQAIWSGPLGPHTLENVGDRPLRLVSVEIKSPK